MNTTTSATQSSQSPMASGWSTPLYTLRELAAFRLGCLLSALNAYRNEHDPKMIQQRAYWTGERIYWTGLAYHYHGELMAQREAAQNSPERIAQLARYWDYVRNRD